MALRNAAIAASSLPALAATSPSATSALAARVPVPSRAASGVIRAMPASRRTTSALRPVVIRTLDAASFPRVGSRPATASRSSLERHGRQSFQRASDRIDGDADRFQRGHTENRLDSLRPEDDAPGGHFAHEFDLSETELVFVDAAVSQLVTGSTNG